MTYSSRKAKDASHAAYRSIQAYCYTEINEKVSFGVAAHLCAAGVLKSTSTGSSGIPPRSLARRTMLC
jgi:hypothetical protein